MQTLALLAVIPALGIIFMGAIFICATWKDHRTWSNESAGDYERQSAWRR